MNEYYKTLEEAVKQYMGLPVLKRIKNNPETALNLEKNWTDATLLFMDIRAFTKMAENTPLDNLLEDLNYYFETMSEIITRHKGHVDSFIGDTIFAIFGIEDKSHADNACKAAVECLESLDKINKKIKSSYPFCVGMGVNSGKIILGNIGSRYKLKYTAMGDMVNLAARLEGLTSKFGCSIICSEFTKKLLTINLNIKELAKVTAKGMKQELMIYSLG
jgi:adenylate cyclase